MTPARRSDIADALSAAGYDALSEAGRDDAARSCRWWAWKVAGRVGRWGDRPASILPAAHLERELRAIGREELAELFREAVPNRKGTLTVNGETIEILDWDEGTATITYNSSAPWGYAMTPTPIADFGTIREFTRLHGLPIEVYVAPPEPEPEPAPPLIPAGRPLTSWVAGTLGRSAGRSGRRANS